MQRTDDLTDPTVIDEPYEYFGELRETNPLYKNETWGGWIVTRYEDVRQCLQDDEHLSVEVEANRLRDSSLEIPRTKEMFPKWIIYLDPPEHSKLRRIIGEAFNPEMVSNQRTEVEQVTKSLVENMSDQRPGEVDFIDEFAHPLPVQVISKIMGFPLEDGDNLGGWSKDIGLTLFHYYDADDRHRRTEEAIGAFTDYLEEIVRERRKNPRDDLISYLNEAEADGERLTEDEVVATAVLLLFAGHETTTKLLANGMLELIRHPQQMELLRNDPSLAPQAVEEILRYQGTSKSLTRGVVKDFELRGKQIKEGERVLLSQAAANRDPRKFDDPDTFDITRGSMEHLGFGHGTHHCLGAPLARLEARVAFSELVRAFPDVELAADEIEWTRSPLVRGPKELPVRL
jgi:cytochrome P450